MPWTGTVASWATTHNWAAGLRLQMTANLRLAGSRASGTDDLLYSSRTFFFPPFCSCDNLLTSPRVAWSGVASFSMQDLALVAGVYLVAKTRAGITKQYTTPTLWNLALLLHMHIYTIVGVLETPCLARSTLPECPDSLFNVVGR